jgi:hypothetical protein
MRGQRRTPTRLLVLGMEPIEETDHSTVIGWDRGPDVSSFQAASDNSGNMLLFGWYLNWSKWAYCLPTSPERVFPVAKCPISFEGSGPFELASTPTIDN